MSNTVERNAMNIPDQLIARLLILNPAYEADDARKAVELLYADPPEWIPLCDKFSIPQVEVKRWRDIAQTGHDVSPSIAHWLDMIGVTEALLTRH